MSKMNRRAVIRGAIVAGTTGAITIAAARQSQAIDVTPALRRHCENVHDLCRETRDADAVLAAAIDRARAVWPVADDAIRYKSGGAPRHACPVAGSQGYEGGKRQPYYIWTSDECDGHLAELRRPSKLRSEWLDMHALALAYEAQCQAVRHRFRVDELHAELLAASAARDASIEAVVTAPVSNVTELALKASALSAAPPFFLMINAPRLAADVIAVGSAVTA